MIWRLLNFLRRTWEDFQHRQSLLADQLRAVWKVQP